MSTSDALSKKEGEFVMQLAGDQPRINAVKLALGSMELPIVQWTIEEDWSLMYFSEGFRLTPESSWLRIYEKSDKDTQNLQIHLPLYLNTIQSIKAMGGNYFSVKTEFPHGLWVEGKRCVIPAIYWGDVDILCSAFGRISLTHLYASRDLEYLSEHEFMINIVDTKIEELNDFGFVYMPTIPSPKSLCDLITFYLTYVMSLGSYCLTYDNENNRASLMSTKYPDDSETLYFKLYGNELTRLFGYFSDEHFRMFHKKTNVQPDLTRVHFDLPNTEDPPLKLPSEIFPSWICVKLTPGWYAPAHRPMCTGSPLRISTEIENAFNRLNFSIPERVPKGYATSHFIVFSDPSGVQYLCPIYAGKYNPETICAFIEDEMTRLSKKSTPTAQFSVNYDDNTKKFTFSCEMKMNKIVVPASFSLHFNHPASIDSTKLGFPNVCLRGSDTYTSNEVFIPYMKWSRRSHFNSYKFSEIGHQKRFMIEAIPCSNIIGLIKGYNSSSSELIIMTYVGQLPYVNGLQKHDVITILPTQETELFNYDPETEHWVAQKFSSCPLAFNLGKNGIVVDFGSISKPEKFPTLTQMHIRVKVKPSPALEGLQGRVVSIVCDNEPFNLCFGNLPKSIPPRSLGFGKGAIQWGVDGIISSGNLQLPPFEAKGVHSLDHPDYVLIYIEEGKKNVGLQHRYENNTTTPFAKLVLYPMFREERMLPRDTTLLGSEMLSTFTLKFRNPDGTPYHFHSVDFSFSLNFIRTPDS
tara:strand:+ start:48 stop:2291 length:2244 start_codon:yes stop_codon:yes gene_type:complete